MKDQNVDVGIVDQYWFIRLLEIFPGAITWLFLLGPIILSLIAPIWVAYFIIAFDLFWLVKSFRLSFFMTRGYYRLHRNKKIDWRARLSWLDDLDAAITLHEHRLELLRQHYPSIANNWAGSSRAVIERPAYLRLRQELKDLIELRARHNTILAPKSLINVVIIATYNESLETLEPTIQSLLKTDYNHKQIWLIIGYEERGGKDVAGNADYLINKYRDKFGYAMSIMHPDGIPGEVRGKGGNITFAGRAVAKRVDEQKIDPEHVIVTTLDADNRPSTTYFAHLSYAYATNVNRIHKSYQPIPMFYNNIWDVPAPMRIIAIGNSFWMLVESMRPHRLRNFAAHAQSLKTLLDTDFWSVSSIVEDGHQYWRTYFAYDGDHQVVPLLSPVFQDAVLADTYFRTFRVQYVQLRRWAWGVSDFPYVVRESIKNNRISWGDKLVQIGRLFEGHFSWATAPMILTFVAWLPLYLNRRFGDQVLAHELPIIAARILTLAMVGLFVTISISMISLPPKPARYRRTRNVGMLLQWVLMPVIAIVFSALTAIDAQTRLMLGKYLDFRVTEKANKK